MGERRSGWRRLTGDEEEEERCSRSRWRLRLKCERGGGGVDERVG